MQSVLITNNKKIEIIGEGTYEMSCMILNPLGMQSLK